MLTLANEGHPIVFFFFFCRMTLNTERRSLWANEAPTRRVVELQKQQQQDFVVIELTK